MVQKMKKQTAASASKKGMAQPKRDEEGSASSSRTTGKSGMVNPAPSKKQEPSSDREDRGSKKTR